MPASFLASLEVTITVHTTEAYSDLRLVPVKFGISRLSRVEKKTSPPELIQQRKGQRCYVVKMAVKVQFGVN
jgi:hypothetical protein